MKGFKDSTKTVSDHCFAGGGIVPAMGGARGSRMSVFKAPKPILHTPRPRVMPKLGKFASGGSTGNSLEQRGGKHAYNEDQKVNPDTRQLRPGYSKGGKKMVKTAKKVVAAHVHSPKPAGHGVKGTLAFMRNPMFGK